MDNPHPQSIKRKSQVLYTALTLTVLLILPVAGIVLIWTISKWHTVLKVIATFFGALWTIIGTIFLLVLFYNGGSVQPLFDQDKMALSYLEQKYNEEFAIGETRHSGPIGGSVTFDKWVSPSSDATIKFLVHKCLARCNSNYKEYTYFTDNYIDELWSKQATDEAQRTLDSKIAPGKLTARVKVDVQDDDLSQYFDKDTGTILSYVNRPNQIASKVGYNLEYSERLVNFDESVKSGVADKLLAMQNYVNQQNAKGDISIRARVITEPTENESGKGQHYYRYNLFKLLGPDNLTKQEIIDSFEEVRYSGRP